jgi:hypothetical protein
MNNTGSKPPIHEIGRVFAGQRLTISTLQRLREIMHDNRFVERTTQNTPENSMIVHRTLIQNNITELSYKEKLPLFLLGETPEEDRPFIFERYLNAPDPHRWSFHNHQNLDYQIRAIRDEYFLHSAYRNARINTEFLNTYQIIGDFDNATPKEGATHEKYIPPERGNVYTYKKKINYTTEPIATENCILTFLPILWGYHLAPVYIWIPGPTIDERHFLASPRVGLNLFHPYDIHSIIQTRKFLLNFLRFYSPHLNIDNNLIGSNLSYLRSRAFYLGHFLDVSTSTVGEANHRRENFIFLKRLKDNFASRVEECFLLNLQKL